MKLCNYLLFLDVTVLFLLQPASNTLPLHHLERYNTLKSAIFLYTKQNTKQNHYQIFQKSIAKTYFTDLLEHVLLLQRL